VSGGAADEHPELGKILVTEDELQAKVAELGARIGADYEGRDPLLICVLRGAFVFMADLARAVPASVEIDFMAVSSYGSSTRTSGVVRIVKDLDTELSGRHVILVEDIIDSGLTLDYLRRNLEVRQPASLEIATLLLKRGIQRVPMKVRYVGFEIPPDFVIGYGLDLYGKMRNLPHVALMEEGE